MPDSAVKAVTPAGETDDLFYGEPRRCAVTFRPAHVNPFEFVVVAALRAQQLLAGSTPRLPGEHAAATLAQMEVAAGCVVRIAVDAPVPADSRQCGWQL